MNKQKANVGKSKSSNVTIVTKVECCKNKKSLSNAEFQSKVLKKRGVYVEKKVTKTNLLKKPIDTNKFLTSVLTILSKSTAGTQYDLDTDKLEKTILEARKGTSEYDEMITDNAILNNNNRTSKKKKCKSKILNDRLNESDQVVVLRSKMDIVHTPSNYSDKSNVEVKWTDFPRLVKAEDGENIQKEAEETAIYHCVADGIGKITSKKVTIDTEPTTLVSDKPKDKLYNFFVDLLETTFSVYNVNTEFIKPTSVSSSRIALQIDESVAKKLEIKKDFDDVNEKPSKYFSINNSNAKWDDGKLLEHFQSKPLSIKLSDEPLKRKKRRTKLDNKNIMNTQSFFLPTKKSNRKHMKKNLLTLFKEQLMMDAESYEEPENLYQALKVMAKNKRRKSIARSGDR
ncbi:hypothetical protein K1T71_000733 [Dendrolimus kikuchii]|uniref:Uncharacterized protein n=1 Tax=Dendrolimus kikuchii TaxID=765133 RepID=A0ACC1DK93_9NEOP|nr:hypothetical protein K1T71_000733 [Dendrolimus kikuchii]